MRNDTLALALVRAELCRATAVDAAAVRLRRSTTAVPAPRAATSRFARALAPWRRQRRAVGDRGTESSSPPD